MNITSCLAKHAAFSAATALLVHLSILRTQESTNSCLYAKWRFTREFQIVCTSVFVERQLLNTEKWRSTCFWLPLVCSF